MFLEWVIGALFRPGATFERARLHLRFGYWWILLSEFSLETVVAYYNPQGQTQFAHHVDILVLFMLFRLFLLVDIQALFLMGAARAFGWRLSWADSLKYVGLAWSANLLESVVLFYPGVTGAWSILFWGNVGFLVWYTLVLFAGIHRLSGLTRSKSILLTAMATVPWQVYLIWQNWSAINTL